MKTISQLKILLICTISIFAMFFSGCATIFEGTSQPIAVTLVPETTICRAYRDNRELGEYGSKISGGQMQRIALARAIYRDKNIIIFDEATNALDKDLEEKVFRLLFSAAAHHLCRRDNFLAFRWHRSQVPILILY